MNFSSSSLPPSIFVRILWFFVIMLEASQLFLIKLDDIELEISKWTFDFYLLSEFYCGLTFCYINFKCLLKKMFLIYFVWYRLLCMEFWATSYAAQPIQPRRLNLNGLLTPTRLSEFYCGLTLCYINFKCLMKKMFLKVSTMYSFFEWLAMQ